MLGKVDGCGHGCVCEEIVGAGRDAGLWEAKCRHGLGLRMRRAEPLLGAPGPVGEVLMAPAAVAPAESRPLYGTIADSLLSATIDAAPLGSPASVPEQPDETGDVPADTLYSPIPSAERFEGSLEDVVCSCVVTAGDHGSLVQVAREVAGDPVVSTSELGSACGSWRSSKTSAKKDLDRLTEETMIGPSKLVSPTVAADLAAKAAQRGAPLYVHRVRPAGPAVPRQGA